MSQTEASTEAPRFLVALGFLFASILCFDLMSVMVRLLIGHGYSPLELSAYRNVLGVIPSLALLVHTGELRLSGSNLRIANWPLAIGRGFVVAIAQFLFYSGIGFLPLATVSALGQTNALFVVLLAVIILRERVGPWRLGALALGFAGALMILRPGSEAFQMAALMPVGAAFCYALSMVTLRLFGPGISNALLYLYSSMASAAGAIVMAAFTTRFSPVAGLDDAAMILAMGILGGCGVLFLMLAYRMAPPSALAPFGYFSLLTAFTFGYLFFDEAPVETLFPGAILIVAAGGLILWRGSRRQG